MVNKLFVGKEITTTIKDIYQACTLYAYNILGGKNPFLHCQSLFSEKGPVWEKIGRLIFSKYLPVGDI